MAICNIRHAELTDLDATAHLFDLYRQFYKKPADASGAHAYIKTRLTKKDSVILVAVNDAKIITGFAQLYPGFSSLSMSHTWVLNDLYVLESHRRKKVAEHLVEKSVSYARSTGATSISLETQHENKKAQALYEKMDFEVENDFRIYFLSLK